MGGKSNLLDPKLLEELYLESIQYKSNAEIKSNNIRGLINQLTDPGFINIIRSTNGNDLIELIMENKQVLENLLNRLNKTANFIDTSLEGTVTLSEEKHKTDDSIKLNKRLLKR